MRHTSIPLVLACGFAGCASIPEVEYRYYPAQAVTTVSVTQSIECNHDKTQLSIIHTPAVTTVYSADRSQAPHTLDTRSLRSAFADSDIKLEWFDDGRLKSVNQSTTGQGESIAKAAMSFLAPVIGGAAVTQAKIKACEDLAPWNGAKPVVILYEGTIRHSKVQPDQRVALAPGANFREVHAAMSRLLGPQLPSLELGVRALEEQERPVLVGNPADVPLSDSAILLSLNRTAIAPVEILVSKSAAWSGRIVVPTAQTYTLPIPKPKLFGTQNFELALNDAGGIVAMRYANVSGTAGAFNALNAVSTTLAPGDAAQASAIRAQADLIAETQRLAMCQARPTDCK